MGIKYSSFAASSSTYLKADEVKDEPKTFTIDSVEPAETPDGKPALQLIFVGGKKFTLNKTNGAILAGSYGDDTDTWIGRKIVVTFDPNVMYGTKRTGGIRVKALGIKVASLLAASKVTVDPTPTKVEDADFNIA